MLWLMNGRDNSDGFGNGLVKLGLGVGIGFALYMMFGGRGGLGFGRGSGGIDSGGRGEGSGTGPAVQQAPDAQPISVRVVPDPSDVTKGAIELEGNLVGISDLIARIVAGGRHDVILIVRGDTRQGAVEQIQQTLTSAGIQIIDRQQPASAVSDPWA